MIGLENIKEMIRALNIFDAKHVAPLSTIIQAYLKAGKLRISAIACNMDGESDAAYKRVQRTFNAIPSDLFAEANSGCFDPNAEAILVDYTEVARPEAKKTSYVGFIKDKTRGISMLALSTPFKGRSLPFAVGIYSSALINTENSSKPKQFHEFLKPYIPFIRTIPIVGDREFFSEGNLRFFIENKMKFVVRFKTGPAERKTVLTKSDGSPLNYNLHKGQTKSWRGVMYKGMKVNLIGYWDPKYNEPLYIICNIDTKKALRLYKLRMKIESTFKDCKDKLGIGKNMSKTKDNTIKMLRMAMLAYALAILLSERLRETVLSKKMQAKFSGLYVLINRMREFSQQQMKSAIRYAINVLRLNNDDEFPLSRACRKAFS